MLIEARRLAERSTRWLVRALPDLIDIAAAAERYRQGVELLSGSLPDVLGGPAREAFEQQVSELREAGVPADLASRVAGMPSMPFAFDVVAIASDTGRTLHDAMTTYFRLGDRLELSWLRERIIELPRANRWQALARAALREDLLGLYRKLASQILSGTGGPAPTEQALERWEGRNQPSVERWLATLADIRASRTYDTTTLPVALRELRRLIDDAEERDRAPAS
jgi:glutamate dehydrogenase